MSSVSSCAHLATLLQGRRPLSHIFQIHAQIILSGAHQDNLIATRLIGVYPSELSVRVFKQLNKPNIFPFNAAIRILAEHGLPSHAFSLFVRLKRQSLSPNEFTFCFLLKACLASKDSVCMKQVHSQILKEGLAADPFMSNGLLNVYIKGAMDLHSAHKVFDGMSETNRKSMVMCWTSLISGFAKLGESEKALQLFLRMIGEGVKPDGETMVSVLSACAGLDEICFEKWIDHCLDSVEDCNHADFWSDSINVVLTYLYGKLGNIEESRKRFDKIGNGMVIGNVVTWNSMINAYVQNGCALEAVEIFRLMIENPRIRPNHVTMVSVLSACAQIGDIDLGSWIHKYVNSKGQKQILQTNSLLATALIDMYSKCGNLMAAKEVFDNMVSKDVISVNAMIMGLAANGQGVEALRLFYMMPKLGFQPNSATFLAVLCACSHSGMLEKGRVIFQDMKKYKLFHPQVEHYACYIDILSKVGLIEEALEVVTSMPFKPNNYVWGAVLCGCLLHSRVEFTEAVSRKLVELDPENSAGYVLLSNSLAFDRHWAEVSEIRGSMRGHGVKKNPGYSWINIDGQVRQFFCGISLNSEMGSVYVMLDVLEKEMRISLP